MTSLVSREDVEDAAREAGVRDPIKLRRLMKTMDAHIMGVKRMYEMKRLMEPFGYLAPGESDVEMGVTRCKQCEVPKKFSQYYKDPASPTEHGNICTRCIRGPGGSLKCPQCGKQRRSSSYNEWPGICKFCEGSHSAA